MQLLDAIKDGDVDAIRALTNLDWNFVYPPAMVNATSGARELEAWCRTPLCLLVRPDEGNFQPSLVGVSEQARSEPSLDPLPHPDLHHNRHPMPLKPTVTPTLTLTHP